MKKFLLTLAVAALAASSMMAQTNVPEVEPDRIQMRALSKNPTGMDIPTGYDAPQVVDKKDCCKGKMEGKKCDKPADQQCPDCKAEGMKHECKKAEGQKCDKAQGMKHECKKADGKKCDKPADQQCPDCKEKAAAKKN